MLVVIYLRIDRGSQRVFGCGWRYSIILMLVLVAYIHVIYHKNANI